MGFSLEGLFTQLNATINNKVNGDKAKLNELIKQIEWWENYAIKCGNMKENTQDKGE